LKKEYGLIIILLVGVIVIIGSFYYISEVGNIPAYTALFISIVTAIYSAITKSNPNKAKKQLIYGQLKKALIQDISKLENKDYQSITLGPWDSYQQDETHQLVNNDNRKLRETLDDILEKIKKYNSIIVKLDGEILPRILKETAEEFFKEEPQNDVSLTISLYLTNHKNKEIQPQLVYHLKRKHSMDYLLKYVLDKENVKEEALSEVAMELHYLKVFNPLDLFRIKREKEQDYSYSIFRTKSKKQITEFWSQCLKKLDAYSEQRVMIEENDVILKEAKILLPKLINRIEKNIEV
jgi:hypothetical protein